MNFANISNDSNTLFIVRKANPDSLFGQELSINRAKTIADKINPIFKGMNDSLTNEDLLKEIKIIPSKIKIFIPGEIFKNRRENALKVANALIEIYEEKIKEQNRLSTWTPFSELRLNEPSSLKTSTSKTTTIFLPYFMSYEEENSFPPGLFTLENVKITSLEALFKIIKKKIYEDIISNCSPKIITTEENCDAFYKKTYYFYIHHGLVVIKIEVPTSALKNDFQNLQLSTEINFDDIKIKKICIRCPRDPDIHYKNIFFVACLNQVNVNTITTPSAFIYNETKNSNQTTRKACIITPKDNQNHLKHTLSLDILQDPFNNQLDTLLSQIPEGIEKQNLTTSSFIIKHAFHLNVNAGFEIIEIKTNVKDLKEQLAHKSQNDAAMRALIKTIAKTIQIFKKESPFAAKQIELIAKQELCLAEERNALLLLAAFQDENSILNALPLEIIAEMVNIGGQLSVQDLEFAMEK